LTLKAEVGAEPKKVVGGRLANRLAAPTFRMAGGSLYRSNKTDRTFKSGRFQQPSPSTTPVARGDNPGGLRESN
jgi:hypothetical protein